MICFLDPAKTPNPPEFLAGARDLGCVAAPDGHIWFAGPVGLLQVAPAWRDIGGGLKVGGVLEDIDPACLARKPAFAYVPVLSSAGIEFQAPIVLDAEGHRAFPVAYGDDWMPELTPAQARALAIAEEIRVANRVDTPMSALAQWTAELLCLTLHVTPKVLQVLRVIDDQLILGVVDAAVSRGAANG